MNAVLRTTTDADRVLTVWMDLPGKSVNTCSPQFFEDLNRTLDAIERDRPAAVIIASAKAKSFNAGADLFEIRKMNREQLAEFVARGQAVFDRIAHLSIPTIAAINGNCMGGGFELSLACRYRVAVDDGSISIGLPETKLGLIPAWGGTTRLPRLIGLRRALPILLAGKTMPPKKAQRAGLVDEVVRPEALQAAAKRIVMSGRAPQRPSRIDGAIAGVTAIRTRVLATAERQTNEKSFGNYPAPSKVLDVVRIGYEQGVAAGLAAERTAIAELGETDAGRNLLRLFFLKQGAAKAAAAGINAKTREVKYAAVIGGGTMGAGIVHALVRAGIPVRLVEVNAAAVSGALGRIKRTLDDDVSAGRIDRLAARHALNRVSPTTEWTGLELADLVIEAVAETIEVKRDVFARLDRLTRPTAVLATNTSSLSVTEMAQATLHPERVVGLHFFNPVPKMPLVEVVRAAKSDDASLATAIAVAVRIGKTPVLVGDAPGFLVNRILIPYLAEALTMAGEGTPITALDDAAKRWGMPMGPFELLDEIGLDVAAHVLRSLAGTTPAPANVAAAFDAARDRKWLGKKSGKGFYVHETKKRRRSAEPEVNDELIKILSGGATPLTVDAESLQWRTVLPMVNEAARVLEEGVSQSTDAIDLSTVFGLGLAPFRGGIMQFANTVGADEIVRRLEELSVRHGSRFAPAQLLRQAAALHAPLAPRPAGATLERVAPPVHAVQT
jgi:3-hydroxyacyl-CoA dehydrogenase/enoyl-CoA hydratase/3-hydroxybutyryl-CoA epimerase